MTPFHPATWPAAAIYALLTFDDGTQPDASFHSQVGLAAGAGDAHSRCMPENGGSVSRRGITLHSVFRETLSYEAYALHRFSDCRWRAFSCGEGIIFRLGFA